MGAKVVVTVVSYLKMEFYLNKDDFPPFGARVAVKRANHREVRKSHMLE